MTLPHPTMTNAEVREFGRQLAKLTEFERARIKTEVRLANVARGKERKRAQFSNEIR